jgi:hypothetical protein
VSGLVPDVSVTGGEAALDGVGVQTLGGDDAIAGGVGVTGLPVVVDGGEGVDTSTAPGSATVSSATENLVRSRRRLAARTRSRARTAWRG